MVEEDEQLDGSPPAIRAAAPRAATALEEGGVTMSILNRRLTDSQAEVESLRHRVQEMQDATTKFGRLPDLHRQLIEAQGEVESLQASWRGAAELWRRARLNEYRADLLSELYTIRSHYAASRDKDQDPLPRQRDGSVREELPSLSKDVMAETAEQILSSGLFSATWYRATYPDVPDGDDAALEHFLTVGLPNDHDPHVLFSAHWYRRGVPASRLVNTFPLLHYLREPSQTSPHPLFDAHYYLANRPDIVNSGINPLSHYLLHGWPNGMSPHPAFDPAWYARSRREGGHAAVDPLTEYLTDASCFDASPHPLFDGRYYQFGTSGQPKRRTNPLLHYLLEGAQAGCNPHPLFDTIWYLHHNPDVAEADCNPLVHFLTVGGRNLRDTHPTFSAKFYAETYPDVTLSAQIPLVHYLRHGAAEGRHPNPIWPAQALAEANANPKLPAATVLLEGRFKETGQAETEIAPFHLHASLPTALREHIAAVYGIDKLALASELMQIVTRFGDSPERFALSSTVKVMTTRLRDAAAGANGAVDVSIIIPVHNALVFTLSCLLSILEQPTRYAIEVLVGDDASTDQTANILSGVGGRLQHVRHDPNIGFLKNCNATATRARGRFLVFLNNDTLAMPGWLDELIGTFDDAKVGLAGSKLLNGDGTLQEAGGILWNDGSGWNFGRNQNPRLPEFNYVKDVDYCSGASIAITRRVWDEVGGFDLEFAPAYCEDCDLAFRVRAAGYRTVYQPFSEIVHHEGRSHGRDVTSGVKAYQVLNQRKLVARWHETFATEHLPNATNVFLARDRSVEKPHILIVDHYVPEWDKDAGSRSMFYFIRSFIEAGFHITFWPENLNKTPIYTKLLQKMGIEVIYGNEYVGKYGDWLAKNRDHINYVFLSRPHVCLGVIGDTLNHSNAKVLYYGHDLHWRRQQQEYDVTRNPALLQRISESKRRELAACGSADVIMYPSEEETNILKAHFGTVKSIITVPVWVFQPSDLTYAKQGLSQLIARDPYSIMFIGGFAHGPNVDGIVWFIKEVLPLIQASEPRFRLTVAGSNPPASLLALARRDIEITGQISDEALGALYKNAGLAIVPLRYGGGVKGKLVEAFSKGIPVVSTSVGLQGIPDGDRLAFTADDASTFAGQVLEVGSDVDVTLGKVLAAIRFIEESYSADTLFSGLADEIPEFKPLVAARRRAS